MNGKVSAPLGSLASRRVRPVMLTLILALGATSAAGCAGSQAGTATTTPATVSEEPRGTAGQLLEDLFFARVPGASRFDMDAATDEDGSYGDEQSYDEVATGGYGDEVASGAEEVEEAEIRRDELRTAQADLTRLESALRAEEHPLAEAVGELRARIADSLAESEESGDTLVLEEGVEAILSELLKAALALMGDQAPRPGNATDCSAATIALYGAVWDTIVEVNAHEHVNAYSYTSDREAWASAQTEQVDAATALIEWIESDPALDDLDAVRESALTLGDGLREIDAYLTPGTQRGVFDALTTLDDAQTEREMSEAIEAVRAAVSATLANVQQPPYEAEIAAFSELPGRLDAVMAQLPSPGPRAALRLYRHGGIARLAAIVSYGNEVLDETMQWAGVACAAPPLAAR